MKNLKFKLMGKYMTRVFGAALAGFLLTACDGKAVNADNNINGVETALSSQTASRTKQLTRKLAYFNTVDINLPCDVYFTQGKTSEARIVGMADDVEKVKLSVDAKGLLSITGKRFSTGLFHGRGRKELKIYLTSTDLVGVNMMGVGDFKTLSPIDTDNLDVSMSGAGDIDFERPVICDNFSVVLRGAGDTDFKKVQAQKANIELYGTGDIDVRLVKVARTDISLKGTGDIDVDFSGCGAAACTLYGTGDIELKGTLRSLSHNKYGTGDIDLKELKVGR